MERNSKLNTWLKHLGSLRWFHWLIIGLSLALTFFASFASQMSSMQRVIIFIGGLIIDALLVFLFITVSRLNKRVAGHAENVTKTLQDKTKNLEKTNQALEEAKQELEEIAHFDVTTKLPNRYSFTKHLKQLIEDNANKNSKLMACILDIDNFKTINDVMGHNRGDELLKAISSLLNNELRETDYLARLTGDEFGIIFTGIGTPGESKNMLNRYVEIIRHPIKLGGNEINISASIGAVTYPSNGNSAEELIKHAEIAMYKAKQKGKNRFAFFDEETKKQIKRRHDIETALRSAIKNDEFHLLYQPQVDTATSKIFGVEALLRWEHGIIAQTEPGEFIPVAEESGLIIDVGEWVLQQVSRDYSTIQGIADNIKISVNTSIKQLEHPKFETQVLSIVKNENLNPKNIALEVTETAMMKNPDKITDLIKKLSEAGFSFALDDFGTGYSSMSYLKKLAISYIKIDQSFVRDIHKDESDKIIARAIIKLAEALDAKTIAEGVETKEEYELLKSLHCDYLQGYLFDKPMKLEALVEKYGKSKKSDA